MTDKGKPEKPTPHEGQVSPGTEDSRKPLSPVLARLIEEVRNEHTEVARAYDRTHHRHNR